MFRLRYFAGLCALAVVSSASGATIYDADLWTPYGTLYGSLDQRTAGITNGNNACGPTAAVNSFIYLKNRFGWDLIPHFDANILLQDQITAVNNVGSLMLLPADPNVMPNGVTDQHFLDGKVTYIANRNLASVITIEAQGDNITNNVSGNVEAFQVTPSWQFVYDQLFKGQDVEVGFQWGTGSEGGHWITATSFHFDDLNDNQIIDNGEVATLDFVDPWGGVHIVGNLSMGGPGGTHMVLTYAGGAAGNSGDPLNPGNFSSGFINIVVAESPEPATFAILAIAAAGLLLRRRRV